MMNRQTKFLTITGGEPTLLKNGLVEILSFCKKYLPMTQIEILSNGRMFFYCSFVDAISSVGIKFLEVGVPLHSWNEKGHDQITLVPGSFVQTVTGIKNLANSNINVEIRVVIQKGNYLELTDIANFIIKEMPNVKRVSFIGMEMLGSAIKNSENIWVNYQEIGLNLKDSIFKLLTHGIKVNIYNIPLCKIDVDLRSLCVKSISDYKVRYLEECDSCKLKDECGGIFVSSKNFVKNEGVVAII
jgi:His-Xaa-Ser system radical SAM maturase HxsC